MYRMLLIISLMVGSNIACSNCEPLTIDVAKKLHPNLALGPVCNCEEVSQDKNKILVGMLYFSDTPKQDIHHPFYDMDVLLVDKKTQSVLSHYHEKELIQEAGVDLSSGMKQMFHASQLNYIDEDIITDSLYIYTRRYNQLRLNDTIKTFSLILSRRNYSDETPYEEEILNAYYIKNNTIYKAFGLFRLALEQRSIDQQKHLGVDRENHCSIKVSKHQTLGFNDFIVTENKESIIYSKDPNNLTPSQKKKTSHRYIVKYDGHEYKIPAACQAKAVVASNE